jgi:hypothetical protein
MGEACIAYKCYDLKCGPTFSGNKRKIYYLHTYCRVTDICKDLQNASLIHFATHSTVSSILIDATDSTKEDVFSAEDVTMLVKKNNGVQLSPG